jgi:V8-like Glu-specific endopeptidase
MRKRFVVTIALGAVVVLAAVASLASASGRAERAGSRVTSHGNFTRYQVSAESRRAATDYWTPERMAAAEPRDMILGRTAGVLNGVPDSAVRPNGSPKLIPGSVPSPSESTVLPVPRMTAGVASVGYAYPFPFSRFEIPGLVDYTSYPYSAIGKIFATDALGDYECSGAAVVSDNESVVWTAGHCVYLSESDWFTNMIFVPAYRDGTTPFGQWIASDAWIPNGWFNSEDARMDVAGVVIAPATTGATLTDTVGGLGFAYGAGRVQHWESFGYPADAPFNGMRQHVCSASFAVLDPFYRRRSTIGIGCDMTAGSSGGPWILDFGGGNYINGLNSYGLRGLPDAMFGPYFGVGAASLLACAEGGC